MNIKKTTILALSVLCSIFLNPGSDLLYAQQSSLNCPEEDLSAGLVILKMLSSHSFVELAALKNIKGRVYVEKEITDSVSMHSSINEIRSSEDLENYWQSWMVFWEAEGVYKITEEELCTSIKEAILSEYTFEPGYSFRAFYEVDGLYLVSLKPDTPRTGISPAIIVDSTFTVFKRFGI